jgi:leucine dehydrogenase
MQSEVFTEAAKRGHEQIAFFNYPEVGLKAIIAIHSTVLGPGLGGCRMRLYASEGEALEDVMRLAEGMTYKNAIAGLDLGGGKACIIADPRMKEGREQLFKQFGHSLNALAGRYISAEDMGTTVADVMAMKQVSKHVAGTDLAQGGAGDPSPWTARGIFHGINAACEFRYGSRDLTGKRVALQGVGHVGMYLLEMLVNAGAVVTITDTVPAAIESACQRFFVQAVAPDAIYDVPADIYAPCAIGQTVRAETLQRLSCDIIAGGANNQLSDSSTHQLIEKKQILYCPDFVINAGGVINVGAEYVAGGWKEPWVRAKVDAIYETTKRVLEESKKRAKFPELVALELAREIIEARRH